jgi:hypothetical protein
MVTDGRMLRPMRSDGRVIWDRRAVEAPFSDLPENGADNPWDRVLSARSSRR